MVLEGHTSAVTSVCYSPRGDRLASASRDGAMHIWDRASGETRAVIRDSDGPIHCVAYSPDGRRLAAAGGDATLRIYDAQTNRRLATRSGTYWPLSSLAWSPDSERIAAGSSSRVHGSTVVVWQAEGLKKAGSLFLGHYEIHDLAYTPSGRHVAIASGMRALVLWAAAELPFTELEELPLDTRLADALPEQASSHRIRFVQRSPVRSISVSASRRMLATADGSDVILWEPHTGRQMGMLRGHRRAVTAIAFGPAGELLASADEQGVVCLWDTEKHRLRVDFDWELGSLTDVVFSPDGQTAAASGGSTIVMWDVE